MIRYLKYVILVVRIKVAQIKFSIFIKIHALGGKTYGPIKKGNTQPFYCQKYQVKMAPKKLPSYASSVKLHSATIAVHFNTVKTSDVPSKYGISYHSKCFELETLQSSQY